MFARQVNSTVWTQTEKLNKKPDRRLLSQKDDGTFFKLDIRALISECNMSQIIPSQRIITCRYVSMYNTMYAVVCEMVILSPLCVSDFPFPTPLLSVINHSWKEPNQEKVWALQLPPQQRHWHREHPGGPREEVRGASPAGQQGSG